jgi:hypothetical protein
MVRPLRYDGAAKEGEDKEGEEDKEEGSGKVMEMSVAIIHTSTLSVAFKPPIHISYLEWHSSTTERRPGSMTTWQVLESLPHTQFKVV